MVYLDINYIIYIYIYGIIIFIMGLSNNSGYNTNNIDITHVYIYIYLVGGRPTPLKNDGVSNSWDHEIPNIWEKTNVPNHQPDIYIYMYIYIYIRIYWENMGQWPLESNLELPTIF